MKHVAGTALVAAILAFAASGASAETISVTIKGFKFDPAEVTAKVGDTIEWTNLDSMPHTATAGDKTFDLTIPPGGSRSFTAAAAGEFPYICMFHRSMKGKVTVSQ